MAGLRSGERILPRGRTPILRTSSIVESCMPDARGDAVARAGVFRERPGATLGRYELLVPIATGGMAHVWAARLVGHGGFTKIVALKTMLPHLLDDPQFEAMFLDEARIAAKLRHTNVCETFDLGEDDGTLYLAMEWIDGPSLLRLVRPDGREVKPIGHRLAAHIIAEACAGLHAAHELRDDDGTPLGVIHRDVSPHNVLLSSAGAVKLTDFGVATARGKSHLSQIGELKGKVAYMSPEALTGKTTIDRRSDIFGLGCALYEITTGRRPFEAESDGAVVQKILNAKAPRPREIDPAFPPDLESIVMTAIAHEPAERFSTAAEMGEALGAYLSKREAITASDVAQLVGARCGEADNDRREQIRLACARRGSSPAYSEIPPRRGSRPSFNDNNDNNDSNDSNDNGELLPLSSDTATDILGASPKSRRGADTTTDLFAPTTPSASFHPDARPLVSVPPAPSSKKPFSFKPTGFTPQVRSTPSVAPTVQTPSSSIPIIVSPHHPPPSSGAISAPPTPFDAPLVPVPLAPRPRRRGLLLGGVAAAVVVVLAAAGAFLFARPPAAVVIDTPAPPAPVVTTPPAVSTPVVAAPKGSPRITFRVTPRTALMLVDGVVMPAGADGIDRPGTGTRRVLFRAEKFEDWVETVDTTSPAVVDVTLVPRGSNVRRPGRPVRPHPSASSSAGSALPNPYE